MKKIFTVCRYALVAGLLVYLAWAIKSDWESVRHLDFTPSGPVIALATLFGFIGFLGYPGLWILMLRRFSGIDAAIGLFHLRIWLQANFLRYVPGKILVAVERVRLGNIVGIPPAINLAIIVWEYVLIVCGAVVLLLFGLAAGLSAGNVIPFPPWVLAVGMAIVVFSIPPIVSFASRMTWRENFFSPLRNLRVSFFDQIGFIVLYGVVWVSLAASYALVCSLFVPLQADQFAIIAFWSVLSYVVGFFLVPVPAGLGVREGVLILGLGAFLPMGQAAALAVIGRLWMIVIEAICLGLAVLINQPHRSSGAPQAD